MKFLPIVLTSSLLIIALSIPMQSQAALGKITNLRAKTKSDTTITLQWKKIPRANFYRVKVLNKNKKKLRIIQSDDKTKKVKNLKARTNYYFRVRAARKGKRGPWSKRIKVKTKAADSTDEDVDDFPILKNLLVEFDDWDTTNNTAGAFVFDANQDKVFFEFGATVEGPDGEKVLPTFEYVIDEDANLYAPVDGIVNQVTYQSDSEDYEVHFGSTADDPNQMTVGIDHILNLTVSEGDTVTAGDIIGNPGTHSTEGLGRTEIEIFGDNAMHCVFESFGSKLQSTYEAKVTQHMRDWETFKGDTSIYDEASMADYAAGCIGFKYDQ